MLKNVKNQTIKIIEKLEAHIRSATIMVDSKSFLVACKRDMIALKAALKIKSHKK
jgi:hypothetical protein